jgi:argininosuccinate lyase
MMATLRFDHERMQAAADSPASAATDLAEHLVVAGTPFRDAHAIVGALVRESLDGGAPLAELVAAHPALGPDAVALLQPGVAVQRRSTPGGAGPAPVAVQRARFAELLAADEARLAAAEGPA